jgi:hypothetical protein
MAAVAAVAVNRVDELDGNRSSIKSTSSSRCYQTPSEKKDQTALASSQPSLPSLSPAVPPIPPTSSLLSDTDILSPVSLLPSRYKHDWYEAEAYFKADKLFRCTKYTISYHGAVMSITV